MTRESLQVPDSRLLLERSRGCFFLSDFVGPLRTFGRPLPFETSSTPFVRVQDGEE